MGWGENPRCAVAQKGPNFSPYLIPIPQQSRFSKIPLLNDPTPQHSHLTKTPFFNKPIFRSLAVFEAKAMNDPQEVFGTRIWRGQIVATKNPCQQQDLEKSLRREATILKNLADRHVIQFYGVEEHPLQLIMEYAENGSLKDAIPNLLWESKRRIAGEIAHGLTYIHSQGIVHCDIKSPNVLLTKKLVAKICDFGSARTATDKKNKTPSAGTFQWKAPEFREDATAYSSKSDVYALGIVMWEMASGEQPDMHQVIQQKQENVPEDYLVAMLSCCEQDPMSRPETQELSFMKYDRGLDEEHERFAWAVWNGDMSRKPYTITAALSLTTDVKVDFDVQKKTASYTLVELDNPIALKSSSTVKSLLESADKGSDRSKAALALLYYESGRHREALQFAQQVRHIPVACYVLGEMYRQGHGVDQNEGEARMLHHDAAKGGLSRSQILMALGCSQAGHHLEALSWYRMAAVLGDPDGQYNFGERLYSGRDVPSDRKEGERWIRKAADGGSRSAMAAMGAICIDRKDHLEAMQWCLKAGDPISHFRIGLMHLHGRDTETSCASAMEWFEKAADQRCGLAAFVLAEIYYKGEMVEMNIEKAMELYSRGREYGDIESTNTLALLIQDQGRRGKGGSKKYVDLLKEAKENGSVLAEANLLLRYM
ncbi:hypothetical protein BGZ68_000218 [Mortierella alpina]|nr:hypothetical protein BGZ68_000218 [Mortierella alpina]